MLITAGPTQEAIDPVRVITNHSSGKMGYALAQACAGGGCRGRAGERPTHLSTPFAGASRASPVAFAASTSVARPRCLPPLRRKSMRATFSSPPLSPTTVGQQCRAENQKSDAGLNIHLEPTVDIRRALLNTHAAATTTQNGTPFCVGFAAESENVEQYGAEKRARKGIPCSSPITRRARLGRMKMSYAN